MDSRWTSAPHHPARPQFTVAEIEVDTAKRRTERKEMCLPQRTIISDKRKTSFEKITISNHTITNNTTNSSEQIFKDTSHTATCTAGRYLGTPSTRRTQWRRVRLSRASTDPGNINEHASNTSSTFTTVTPALHVAHSERATIARSSKPLRRPSDSRTDKQNKDWMDAVDQVQVVTFTTLQHTSADE
ncbi:hypothetical protein MMC13_008047 [Lambiella insularis]|nr:hypothetical protein [Lambiella insularis]